MKRKLVPGRLDGGSEKGEGRGYLNDNRRVTERQYSGACLCLRSTGEENQNLLQYVPLRMAGGRVFISPWNDFL